MALILLSYTPRTCTLILFVVAGLVAHEVQHLGVVVQLDDALGGDVVPGRAQDNVGSGMVGQTVVVLARQITCEAQGFADGGIVWEVRQRVL